MSRSYRRPFAAITGNVSAKDDKRRAHRGVRRKQSQALKTCLDYQDLILPHPLECSWNDVWCWGRDGHQVNHSYWRHSDDDWRRHYYLKLLRK